MGRARARAVCACARRAAGAASTSRVLLRRRRTLSRGTAVLKGVGAAAAAAAGAPGGGAGVPPDLAAAFANPAAVRQAEQLWATLDEMAESSPDVRWARACRAWRVHDAPAVTPRMCVPDDGPVSVCVCVCPTTGSCLCVRAQAYRAFIEKQRLGAAAEKATRRPHIMPVPGFVVRTPARRRPRTACDLADGPLYVNVCSHGAVGVPLDAAGVELPAAAASDRGFSTAAISLPLTVTRTRRFTLEAGGAGYAVDVIYNTWVLERCKWDRMFKDDVARMALKWIGTELDIGLDSVRFLVSGGGGVCMQPV